MKAVLFITRKWPPAVGGMETYSIKLVEALKTQANLRVEALPGRTNGAPPSPLSILTFGAKTSVKVMFGPGGYDVIHGADMALWPLVLLANPRSPHARLVLSAHGTDVAFASRNGFIPFLYRCYLRLGAALLRNATVIANSHATAALLQDHGVAASSIIPLAATSVADDAPESSPERYVLFVGRLIERKGCGWFIREVLPLLTSDIRLKVAGTVIDEGERSALDHPRVDYCGPVFGEQLAKLRRRAIAVVVSNIVCKGMAGFEGFGLTAVEGAAAGGVVIAAAIDGIADAVVEGETGFLLPPGDANAWAEKIHEIDTWSAERRRGFINNAIATVQRDFSWARVAGATLQRYESPVSDTTDTAAMRAQSPANLNDIAKSS